jgi:hypothetical protein
VVVNDVDVHEDDDEAESKRLLSLAMGEAMAAYRSALRINPSYGAATVALAKLLHIEKRYEEEEHVLRSTLTHAGFARDSDGRAVGGGREWRDMMVKLVRAHTCYKRRIGRWLFLLTQRPTLAFTQTKLRTRIQ